LNQTKLLVLTSLQNSYGTITILIQKISNWPHNWV